MLTSLTLRKSQLAKMVAIFLLGLSSIAQISATEIPEITPVTFDTLKGEFEGAPLFVDIGNKTFLLSQKEWYQIQAYAHEAAGLPDTESELRSATRFPAGTDFNDDYKALLGTFTKINKSGNEWNKIIYPQLVDVALSLANYGDLNVRLIQPLITQISSLLTEVDNLDYTKAERHRKAAVRFLGVLKKFSDQRHTEVSSIIKKLVNFQGNVTEQKAELESRETAFGRLLDKDEPANLRKDVKRLLKRVKDLNESISNKKRDIGLTAIGGPLALLIGGSIQGAQLEDLKSDLRDVEDKLSSKEKELAHAKALALSYELGISNIRQTEKLIAAALPHIRTIQTHWQSMGKDFETLIGVLNEMQGPEGLKEADITFAGIVEASLAAEAQENWKNISAKARKFVQNAYVVVKK